MYVAWRSCRPGGSVRRAGGRAPQRAAVLEDRLQRAQQEEVRVGALGRGDALVANVIELSDVAVGRHQQGAGLGPQQAMVLDAVHPLALVPLQ